MSNQSKNRLLHIATIGKSVGLRGDMKLHIKSDFPEQFKSGSTFLINDKDRVTLTNVNLNRGLVKINSIDNPEDAKKFTNVKLYTTYEETRKNCHLKDGEFFWFDIIGCEVFEDDKRLGVVKEIERITLSNYLSIKTDDSLIQKNLAKSFLLPYNEHFILSVDIDKKIIKVNGAMDILEAS